MEEIIYANSKLATESRVSTLAVRIAIDVLFGKEVMRQCTPQGCRDKPALPRDELYTLKREIFQLFPKYHRDAAGFEGVWSNCIAALGQACKRLRKN